MLCIQCHAAFLSKVSLPMSVHCLWSSSRPPMLKQPPLPENLHAYDVACGLDIGVLVPCHALDLCQPLFRFVLISTRKSWGPRAPKQCCKKHLEAATSACATSSRACVPRICWASTKWSFWHSSWKGKMFFEKTIHAAQSEPFRLSNNPGPACCPRFCLVDCGMSMLAWHSQQECSPNSH